LGWFTDWFGTKYYQLLYQHRDDTEAKAFLDALVQRLGVPVEKRILDVGCGKGRHSIYLAEKGFDVVGIDVSEENISEAKMFENRTLHFVQQDMRLPFSIGCFDLAVNLFTSFGYFKTEKEDLETLKNIHNAMNHNGLFVLDFFNAAQVRKNLVAFEEQEIEGVSFEIKRCIRKKIVEKDISVCDHGFKQHFGERVKMLDIDDFEGYFRASGFKVVDVFGDYQLKSFNIESSERLIMIAQKL
jgi:SAM-dependent methyltransferase